MSYVPLPEIVYDNNNYYHYLESSPSPTFLPPAAPQNLYRRNSSASSVASTVSSQSSRESVYSGTRAGRDILAKKLHQNWIEKLPDLKEFDDSLTNLNWLHNMNPMKLEKEDSPRSQDSIRHATSRAGIMDPQERRDYRANPAVKPPYSYASLICMAMRELGRVKITLSDIYAWITDNFMYYRVADSSWQNSVRHNLSLNKCFEKVPRRKDEPGKGGFWRINPKYADVLENGLTKRRRTLPHITPSRQQQQQSSSQHTMASLSHSPHYLASSPPPKRARNIRPLPPCRRPRPTVTSQRFAEEYRTAETNDKVDTQMRDMASLLHAPVFVEDPLNQMMLGGLSVREEDSLEDLICPSTPQDSSSSAGGEGEEISDAGSETDRWDRPREIKSEHISWDDLRDLDNLLGLN